MKVYRQVMLAVLLPGFLAGVLPGPGSAAGEKVASSNRPPELRFPELQWRVEERVPGAENVFPSCADPDVVFVSSPQGLWRTRDNGASWQKIEKTAAAEIGPITDLEVCPARPEFVVLGTATQGVFLSHDGGSAWEKAGQGLVNVYVQDIEFSREDRTWNTLLVSHDTRGAGLSKSTDGGKKWRALSPARHFRKLVSFGTELAASSAQVSAPAAWQLAYSGDGGESWQAVKDGITPTTAARSLLRHNQVFWGTAGGGGLWSCDNGASYAPAGCLKDGQWSSVFVTPGHFPQIEYFWAFDPVRHGLVGGDDVRTAWTPRNQGLDARSKGQPDGHAAANLNGTRFYACVNGALYAGQHVRPADEPLIRAARALPPVLMLKPIPARPIKAARRGFVDAARNIPLNLQSFDMIVCRKDCFDACKTLGEGKPLDESLARAILTLAEVKSIRRFNLQVELEHPQGPQAVQKADFLPGLPGVKPLTLYDDGFHNDGKARDGLWGGTFAFDESQFALGRDRQDPFPGLTWVLVRAWDAGDHAASWMLMLGVYEKTDGAPAATAGGPPDTGAVITALIAVAKGERKELQDIVEQALAKLKTRNAPPSVQNLALECGQGEACMLTLPATDADDLPGAIQAEVTAEPAHGKLERKGPTEFVYRPEGGYVGRDSFTWKARDGKAESAPARVEITVLAGPTAPGLEGKP